MAVTTIVHCDKCGSQVVQDRSSFRALCGPLRLRPNVDLCGACGDDLVTWIGGPTLDVVAERPRPSKAKPAAPVAAKVVEHAR